MLNVGPLSKALHAYIDEGRDNPDLGNEFLGGHCTVTSRHAIKSRLGITMDFCTSERPDWEYFITMDQTQYEIRAMRRDTRGFVNSGSDYIKVYWNETMERPEIQGYGRYAEGESFELPIR